MSAVSNCFQRRALEKVVLKRGLAGNGLTDGRLLFVRLCLSNSLTITSLGPALVRLWLFIFQVNSDKEFKKKIVGHFEKHRKHCNGCQSQVTWKVKFKWQFCPFLYWKLLVVIGRLIRLIILDLQWRSGLHSYMWVGRMGWKGLVITGGR